MSSQYVRPVTPLQKTKFRVYSMPWPGGANRKASLEVEVINNNVWFKCWLNHPEEDGMEGTNKPVTVRLGPVEAEIIFQRIENIAKGDTTQLPPFVSYKNKSDGNPGRDVQCKVVVNRSDKGDIFIGVSEPGRKKVMFPLNTSYWFSCEFQEDNYENRSLMSNMVAPAWVAQVRSAMKYTLNHFHVDEKILAEERKRRQAENAAKQADARAAENLGTQIADNMGFD